MLVDSSPSKCADVLVIGAGPAGVSAATALARALHSVIVFDDDKPANVWNTPVRHVPSWEGKPFNKLRESSLADFGQYPDLIRLVKRSARSIKKTDDGTFELVDDAKDTWLGRKLILCAGVEHTFPAIDGYAESFTTGIFPCMFQFGYEQHGCSSAGLLAVDLISIPMYAQMLSDDGHKFCDQFTIYVNGNEQLAAELRTLCGQPNMSVDGRKIIKLRPTGSGSQMAIHFEDGSKKEEGFLVHRPDHRITCPLVDQLQLPLTDFGNIEVNMPFCSTKVPGVFAAGDCASPLKMIPNAFAMGTYAANGAARELAKRHTV